MAKGTETTSTSRRHAIGNAHQRVTRKNPKGKCPIHTEGKYYKKERKKAERKEAIAKRDINAWVVSFVVFVFSLPACSIASMESRNTGY